MSDMSELRVGGRYVRFPDLRRWRPRSVGGLRSAFHRVDPMTGHPQVILAQSERATSPRYGHGVIVITHEPRSLPTSARPRRWPPKSGRACGYGLTRHHWDRRSEEPLLQVRCLPLLRPTPER